MKLAFAGFRHDHIVDQYLMALGCEDICVTGAFEENDEVRAKVRAMYNVKFPYQSYEELLADPEVEAVAIGDYYGRRGSLAIQALEHGKHVFVDKPLCTDLAELEQIKKLSEEKGLCVGCVLVLRYMSQVQKAKELIQKGEIGDVKIISFTGQHCLNYQRRPKWYFEEGKHGGTINDIAIHGIDLVRMITGKDVTSVNHAMQWNAFASQAPQFKDCAQFSAMMGDTVLTADVSYAAPKYEGVLPTYWNFRFWGTKGMMSFNRTERNVIHLYRNTEEIITCNPTQDQPLLDFLKETQGVHTVLDTASILESQRQVLMIQKEAE